MRTRSHAAFLAGLVLACVLPVLAGTVTLDMNGFQNLAGGQITGPGLDTPIKMEPKAPTITLQNLQAGATYGVDFFHNTGAMSSDFQFTMNAAGTGVQAVRCAEGIDTLFDGFTPDTATLKLQTFKIVYNANSGQTGVYFIQGLVEAYKLAADKGPQELLAIPGTYPVDNLCNTGGGNEDFAFFVDAKGQAGPVDSVYPIRKDEMRTRDANEYATFAKHEIRPRTCTVTFRLEASAPVNFFGTHKLGEITANGNVYEFASKMTVGAGGLNVWSFGKHEVTGGDATLPDGTSTVGTKSENDYHFYPVLRYDLTRQAFYFETLHGPDATVTGAATGFFDGNENPLTVKVTATIAPEPVSTNDGKGEGMPGTLMAN